MNQETMENVIGRMDEVRGLLEMQGKAAALPRLERHIQDLRELGPPPRRPLSSLTEEEAAEVYRLAFGNDYELENVTYHQDGAGVTLWVYDRSELVINDNGIMCAVNTCYGNDALDFNAVAVVRFLDELGIQLG